MSNRLFALPLAILVAAASAASCSRDPNRLKVKYLANGDRHAAQKKYGEAIVEYRKALLQDGHFGQARLKLGVAYQANGDMNNAYREFVRAADLMPESVEAQLHAGNARLAAGEYPEAKARAIAVLAKDPKNIDGLMLMGNALAGLKDYDGAITQMEEAIETNPHLTLSYANIGVIQLTKGNETAAEMAFKRATELNPKSLPARLALGSFYWAVSRLPEAEREFKAAFEIDSRSAPAARAIAAFYMQSGRVREAEPFLKVYAESGTEAKLLLADYYLSHGRTKDAASVLQLVSEQREGLLRAKLRLAGIAFLENRRSEAYQTIEDVLKQSSTHDQALEMKARFLGRDGKFDEAIHIADTIIKRNPNALGSLYIRAVSLESKRDFEKSEAGFRALLQKAPALLAGQLELGKIYLIQGNTKGALELLGGTVKAHPRSAVAHFLLGQAMLREGDLIGAERELVPLSRAFPSWAEVHTWVGLLYQARREPSRSRAAFDRALALGPKSAVVLAGVVSADLSEKKHDLARTRVESALAAAPKDIPMLLLAANTYLAIGDTARAQSTYETLLQVDPSNLETFSRLGLIYSSQGRLDEAKKKYEELERLQERPIAAVTLLGMIFELEKNQTEAVKRYRRAIELDPQAAVASNNLAWIYAESGKNLDVALQLAQTAKASLPDVPQVNDTLGWIYYKKGLTSIAVGFLEEAVRKDPSSPNMQYRLGLAYLKLGDKKNARTSLEQALKLNPQFPEADDAKRAIATIKG